ncbi:MAG: hypothetical protein AAGC67_00505 [Myxococcota bacterium]
MTRRSNAARWMILLLLLSTSALACARQYVAMPEDARANNDLVWTISREPSAPPTAATDDEAASYDETPNPTEEAAP